MRKLFAAVAAMALVGCAGTREARTEEPREQSSWQENRERWDVVHARANATASPAAAAADAAGAGAQKDKKKEKEHAGTGGSGLIDSSLIAPVAVAERAPEPVGDKPQEKKSEAKDRPARRPLQPGAVAPEPAE